MRLLSIALALSACAAAASGVIVVDDEIEALLRRIEVLAPLESRGPRIDTLRHAAKLLEPAAPERSRSLRQAAAELETGSELPSPAPLVEERRPLERAIAAGDRDAVEQAAEAFLATLEHSQESPEDYAWFAAMRRGHDIIKGGDNPSVRAREALADLAELLRTDFEFALTSLDGAPVTLRAAQTPTIVAFWATWCAPCVEELRMLNRVYRRAGVPVAAITDEPAGVVRRFVAAHPVSFPILLDPNRTTFTRYKIETLPALILIDAAGRLRARSGPITEPDLSTLLHRLQPPNRPGRP